MNSWWWRSVVVGSALVALSVPIAVAQPVVCESSPLEDFGFTDGLETSLVPPGMFAVDIRAIGAGGGTSAGPDSPQNPASAVLGGSGVSIRASFPVTPGEVLTILVGGLGEDRSEPGHNGGGGGGSFVYRTANLGGLLIAAGGGASGLGFAAPNKNGSGTTAAFAGSGTAPGAAGTGGNGGAGSTNPAGGAGGGGLLTSGGSGGSGATGGGGVAAGAVGGTGCCAGNAGNGGFGGGGGGGSTGGAGGGGFNGGVGDGAGGDGGGGSSFVSVAGTPIPVDIAPFGPSDGSVFLCYSAAALPVSEIPTLSGVGLATLVVGLLAAAMLLLRRVEERLRSGRERAAPRVAGA